MYGTAKDVMRAFNTLLGSENIRVQLHTRVTGLGVANGAISAVHTDKGDIQARTVILATGGSSYPKTGTTGDGYRWAAAVGHTVVPVRAALAPIQIHPALPRDWQGVAMRDCCVSAVHSGKRIASWHGDLLFTHEGLSGPCPLEISREAAAALEKGPVHIVMDLVPDEEFDQLDQTFSREVAEHRQRSISTLLDAKMPNRLVDGFLAPLGVDPQTRGYVLTRDARRAIVRKLKEWDLGQVARIPIERGEVTAGGIALKEIDPQTMRSRIVKGLYACGEVLDIAGPIGGYNLQAAFSTGYVAGESAAFDELRTKNS